MLVFEKCHRRHCFRVQIVDNNQLEDTEFFELRLFRSGLAESINLATDPTIVEIIDEDSKCLSNELL